MFSILGLSYTHNQHYYIRCMRFLLFPHFLCFISSFFHTSSSTAARFSPLYPVFILFFLLLFSMSPRLLTHTSRFIVSLTNCDNLILQPVAPQCWQPQICLWDRNSERERVCVLQITCVCMTVLTWCQLACGEASCPNKMIRCFLQPIWICSKTGSTQARNTYVVFYFFLDH